MKSRLLSVALVLLAAESARAGSIYWTDYHDGWIRTSALDGSGVSAFLHPSNANEMGAIEVDAAAGHVFWADRGSSTTNRVDIDGTDHVVLDNSAGKAFGLALDAGSGRVYWSTDANSGIDTIRSRDVLGGTPETLAITFNNTSAPIEIALGGGRVYWVDHVADTLERAFLDGTGRATLFDGADGLVDPAGLALDLAHGHVYWTDFGTQSIRRGNLDGSGTVTDLVTSGLANPRGLALDLGAGYMYWTDIGTQGGGGGQDGRIMRARLDGTAVEVLVSTGLMDPMGIALVPDQPPVPEPGTCALLAGAAALEVARRRRGRSDRA